MGAARTTSNNSSRPPLPYNPRECYCFRLPRAVAAYGPLDIAELVRVCEMSALRVVRSILIMVRCKEVDVLADGRVELTKASRYRDAA